MVDDIKLAIKEMRLQNMGYKMIAKKLRISRETVRYHCKRLELEGTRGEVVKKQYITCKGCGKEIAKSRQRKYCSVECRKSVFKPEPTPTIYKRSCKRCNKDFETTNWYAKYCCEDCVFIKTICRGCNKEFRSREEGRMFCSAKCVNNSKRKSHEEYMVEFFNVHKGNIVPLELYQGSDIKLKSICLHCGNEMNRLARFYIGSYEYGCKYCNNKSKGENKIAKWLDEHNIEYERQYSFPDLKYKQVLFYDFAVINNGEVKALIEYDGEQHREAVEFFGGEEKLKERLERDELKDGYAKHNNIRLIRIREKQTISKALREFL